MLSQLLQSPVSNPIVFRRCLSCELLFKLGCSLISPPLPPLPPPLPPCTGSFVLSYLLFFLHVAVITFRETEALLAKRYQFIYCYLHFLYRVQTIAA